MTYATAKASALAARLGVLLSMLGSLFLPAAAAETDSPLRVLALRSTSFFVTGGILDQAALDALKVRTRRPLEIYTEVIDPILFQGVDFKTELVALLKKKYADRTLDLILASGRPALDFADHHRDLLWPGVPVVFYNVAEDGSKGRSFPLGFTGISIGFNLAGTLELITQLQPTAKNLVVVAGLAEYDKSWLRRVTPLLRGYESRFQITYLTHHTVAELLAEVRRLAPDSAVLYLTVVQDARGSRYLPRDVADLLGKASAVPIYVSTPGALETAVLGGWAPSPQEHGTRAGELAAKVLSAGASEMTGSVPVVPARCAVNWPALKHWKISESLVPSNCTIQSREASFWETYRSYIVAALAVILFQTMLIATLLVTRARRQRSESALRQSEDRLRRALEAGRMGVWDWDANTRTLMWSGEHFAIMGLAPFSIQPTYKEWASRVHPEDLPRAESIAKRAIAARTDFRYEYRIAMPDGNHRWLEARAHPIFDRSGACVRVTGLTVDVTERKRVEEANKQLAHVSRVAVVGELTGSIAHEINQPLGAILSNAETAEILLNSSPVPLDEVRQIVGDIRRDNLRAAEIVRHMRALLRKNELAIEAFDLNQAISDVIQLVSADLSRRGVVVTADLAPLPLFQGDRVHVQQVLLNLIHNGVDAMADLPPAMRQLEVRTRRCGDDALELVVSDAGPGVAQEVKARLFESFYTTKKDGLGLGLSIAKTIVKAHGGRIASCNRPSGGATFQVVLPLNRAPPVTMIKWPSSGPARAVEEGAGT
jgi:PAS domain S-box-containing protein